MADPNEFQQLIQVLTTRMDRQEKQQEVTNDLLSRMLTQQESMFALQQNFQRKQEGFNERQEKFNERQEKFNERQEKFNERQEKFNERQDQFNIIFLDEIRDIKADVRGLKQEVRTLLDVTIKQHDERLKRLEDFMDGFLRKAG
ncbi:hypothetical protein ACFQ48_04425 [Hymenobacter caeli]|uniref:Chromosome segregation ATPase n=1 Tax=Hymenobacter caeli TaxID=2735894 RepID=A0ABX2FS47_9BACT|nr:hypothetical protein [Hymenobacter caeli]NRT19204.1 chromosome segregation ATPase [Hymenobacter caeli]